MTSAWPEPAEPPLSALIRVAGRLRAVGCVFAEDEAALLVEAATDRDELGRLVARRTAGEPLEHLLGWAEFAGLRIAVGPGVFVPRRRSELLVRLAADHLRRGATSWGSPPAGAVHGMLPEVPPGSPAVVIDLCCGSAALGAALAATLEADGWPERALELHAADVDPAAAEYARRNLARFAPLSGHVHTGDLFSPLPAGIRGRVDVILANAPYVPTDEIAFMPPEARDHEPVTALDGGADGLDLHRRIAAQAQEWLAPGGLLLIEVGARQVSAALGLLGAVGLHPRAEEDHDFGAVAVAAVRRR